MTRSSLTRMLPVKMDGSPLIISPKRCFTSLTILRAGCVEIIILYTCEDVSLFNFTFIRQLLPGLIESCTANS